MTSWSVAIDIGHWLRGLGLGLYEIAFRENEIDAEVLPELTELDLEKLGFPLGHRKRLLKAIAELVRREKVGAHASTSIPAASQEARHAMEGWEPIATAPKDGRYLRVNGQQTDVIVAWSRLRHGWVFPCHPLDEERATLLPWDPTHWTF